MASTYSTNLKIELIGTGEQAGTWGTTTNANLGTALEQAIVGKADVTMSSTTITLTLTNTNAAQDARAIYLNLTGSPGGAAVLEVPAVEKPYIVKNGADEQVTIKVSGQTGVPIPTGKTALVYNNGTDVVTSIDYIPSLTLGAALPVASGGTGSTSTTFVDLTTNVTGTLPVANGGTGITSLGANVATFLGTPSSANLASAVTDETGSGALVFGTSPSISRSLLNTTKEKVTVTATAATGTVNFDVLTQSVLYYTSNASGNWTLNVRGDASTTLDSIMSTGEAITIAFLVTMTTARYQTGFQINGSAITPEWQGGSAPTSGNANSIDVYTVTIIKTGAATFKVFESQTQFA